MPRLVYDGKPHPMTGEVVLGRHRDCTIPLADGKASRRHARVFSKPDGTIWVEDGRPGAVFGVRLPGC